MEDLLVSVGTKIFTDYGMVAFLGWGISIWQTYQVAKERAAREADRGEHKIEADARTRTFDLLGSAIKELATGVAEMRGTLQALASSFGRR